MEVSRRVNCLQNIIQKKIDKIIEKVMTQDDLEVEDCYFTFDDFGDLSISIEEIKGLLPFIQE